MDIKTLLKEELDSEDFNDYLNPLDTSKLDKEALLALKKANKKDRVESFHKANKFKLNVGIGNTAHVVNTSKHGSKQTKFNTIKHSIIDGLEAPKVSYGGLRSGKVQQIAYCTNNKDKFRNSYKKERIPIYSKQDLEYLEE